MAKFGLDKFVSDPPKQLIGKRVGVVCHAASINSSYRHIIDIFASGDAGCTLSAVFGPQHGLFGQTQDNMVEWEGGVDEALKIPVYSLYGEHRRPTAAMLEGLDALVFDVQDVGAKTLHGGLRGAGDSGLGAG